MIGRILGTGPRSRYAIVSFLGQVAFAAITLGSSLIIARLLGAEGKGEYTAWTLVTLFGSLILAGTISTGLGRAYLNGERRPLAGNVLIHGALALLVTSVMSVPAIALGLDPVTVIPFFVVAVPANVVLLDLLVVFQAGKRPVTYQFVRIMKAVTLTGGLIVVAVVASDQARSFAFSLWGVGTVVSAIAALIMANRHYGFDLKFELPRLARLGRGSLTTNLIDWVMLRADQFLVLAITGSFGLGVYSVAVNVAEVALYVGNSIGLAVFEDERTLGPQATRRLLLKSFYVLAITTVLIAGTGIALVEPVFGADFGASRLPLLLLAPGMIARGVGYAGSQMLLARGQGRPLARAMFVLMLFDLAVTAGLTGLIGIEGAALGSSVIYVCQAVWVVRLLGTHSSGGATPSLPVARD